MPKITKRLVDSLKPDGRDYFLWDDELPGFGLRVFASGRRSYLIQYRVGGRSRRFTIGPHGVFTPDEARRKAADLLADIRNGADPAETKKAYNESLTVAELCDLYVEEGCATKKPLTLTTDRGRIERHIKPVLGTLKVQDVQRHHIERFMRDVAEGKTKADVKTGFRGRAIVTGGKGAATRALGLLGSIFSFAVSRQMRADNPTVGVKRFKEQKCERFLVPEELKALGSMLAQAEQEGENPVAVAAIRALILTGCRRNEVLSLKRAEVDIHHACLRLGDSKTGQKIVPLGAAALQAIVEAMERFGKRDSENLYVFPGKSAGSHLVGLQKIWERLRVKAGLADVRLHDLRHSFASVGASSGLGLVVIGSLLGHRHVATTGRYAHIGNDPLRNAADSIAGRISDAMNVSEGGEGTSNVVQLARGV